MFRRIIIKCIHVFTLKLYIQEQYISIYIERETERERLREMHIYLWNLFPSFFWVLKKNLGFLKKPGFFKSMVIHMYEEGNRYLSLNTLFYVNQTTSYTCAHPSTQNPSTWSHTHTEYCKPVVYLMLFVFSSAKSLIWQMPCSRQWDTGLMSFAWPI